MKDSQGYALSPAAPRSPAHGFSLVELSIVLVILGLITGGILAGQSLIRAAELRSAITEYQRYVGAFRSFQDKYLALPGDMPDATSYWGVAHATPATCLVTASTSSLTCDGDGDGTLNMIAGSHERFRAWQHLANAGLIEGTYSGVTGSGGVDESVIGANVPASKLTKAGFDIGTWGVVSGSGSAFDGNYGHILRLGGFAAATNLRGTVLRAEEAWNIDTKLDDGKPAYGNVRAYKNASRPNCTSTDVSSTAAYVVTSTSLGCELVFISGF